MFDRPVKSLHSRIESGSTFFAMFAVVFRDIICRFPSRIHSGGLLFSRNSIQPKPKYHLFSQTQLSPKFSMQASTRLNLSQLKKQRQIVKEKRFRLPEMFQSRG